MTAPRPSASGAQPGGGRSDDAVLDRLLMAYGRWLLVPTLISLGDATRDDDRLAKTEYEDAHAAVLGRMAAAHPAARP